MPVRSLFQRELSSSKEMSCADGLSANHVSARSSDSSCPSSRITAWLKQPSRKAGAASKSCPWREMECSDSGPWLRFTYLILDRNAGISRMPKRKDPAPSGSGVASQHLPVYPNSMRKILCEKCYNETPTPRVPKDTGGWFGVAMSGLLNFSPIAGVRHDSTQRLLMKSE